MKHVQITPFHYLARLLRRGLMVHSDSPKGTATKHTKSFQALIGQENKYELNLYLLYEKKYRLWHSLIVGLGCYFFKHKAIVREAAAVALFINKEGKFVNHQ